MYNVSSSPHNTTTIDTMSHDDTTMSQLQDDVYTVIWAPILFATVIALSLVGILVPLWEFLFQRVSPELYHECVVGCSVNVLWGVVHYNVYYRM